MKKKSDLSYNGSFFCFVLLPPLLLIYLCDGEPLFPLNGKKNQQMNRKEKKESKRPEDKLRFCAASRLSITGKHSLTALSPSIDHPTVTNDGKQKATNHTAQNQNRKKRKRRNKSGWDQGPLVCQSVINNRKSAFQGSYLSAH